MRNGREEAQVVGRSDRNFSGDGRDADAGAIGGGEGGGGGVDEQTLS